MMNEGQVQLVSASVSGFSPSEFCLEFPDTGLRCVGSGSLGLSKGLWTLSCPIPLCPDAFRESLLERISSNRGGRCADCGREQNYRATHAVHYDGSVVTLVYAVCDAPG